jgi:catechol O-methyltransferase
MNEVWSTRIKALPWALRVGGSILLAWLRREPSIQQAALDFVREHAAAGNPDSVLRALDRFARERRFLMNVGDEKGPLLDDVIAKAGPGARVLELGSFVGYSAILMARHLGKDGRLVSVDVNPLASRVSREMAELAGVADRVEFLTGKSTELIGTLEEPFDVVFVDHSMGLYRQDVERILERKLLRPGAVIVADNVGPLFGKNPYVPWMQARADFESSYVKGHIEYQDIEDAVLVSRLR